MRVCATSTAGGERVERGKAAEIASPSCVHGISEILSQILVDGRSEVDVFEAGLCVFVEIHTYTTSAMRKGSRNFLMSLIRRVMHLGRKKQALTAMTRNHATAVRQTFGHISKYLSIRPSKILIMIYSADR